MRAGVVLALALPALLAGCSASETNPHLLAPKVVLAPLDDGNVTLYVHSAFGERLYDRMELAVENVTVATRENSFSIETKIAADGFFLEVTTFVDSETYHLAARVDVDRAAQRVHFVQLREDGRWADLDTYAVPYERIVERVVA